jgi:hypothetical protein
MMHEPQQFPMARQSAGVAPLRRPGSIRRTTSIDSTWPDGASSPWAMEGRARDLFTPFGHEAPRVLAEAGYRLNISPTRQILQLATEPPQPWAQQLIGIRAGGESRRMIATIMGDFVGTPLYQILDDFAGASLVARWIWSQWLDDWAAYAGDPARKKTHGREGNMVNVCTGFAEGSSALLPGRLEGAASQNAAGVGQLENPDDLAGWHDMPTQIGPAMRRARRMDFWREGDLLMVDAAFQDSGTTPAGGRKGVHEYRVYAEIDAANGVLVSLQVLPLILPFAECPGASVKAARLVGQKVEDFRGAVLDTLPEILGCTHLNDVLRALADVPRLARCLG